MVTRAMPPIRAGVDLTDWNTLRLPARALHAAILESEDEVASAADWARDRNLPLLVLGQGSNVILAGDFPGLVVRMALGGLAARQRGTRVELDVGAGENWHALVQWCLARGWHGLENLTLIPGQAGAAPVQNIGAYGIELSHCLVAVRGWDLRARRFRELSAADCELAYRDSIFKRELRDRFVITRLRLRLSTAFQPVLDYPALSTALADCPGPDAQAVEAAVRSIRQSKLPDPAQLPNAGSLFKNPVLSPREFEHLRARYPGVPGFPRADGVKVPAAWLLECAGWKARRRGGLALHEQQALVLVHHGGADGAAVLAFVDSVRRDIAERFGVQLELEPRVFGVEHGAGQA